MRSLETRLTSKGQVTIPAAIRARLGLKPRDLVRFEVEGDEVRLKPVRSSIRDSFGMVTPHQRPEDWAKIRIEVEEAIGEEAVSRGR